MTRVLVTGATGFIGAACVAPLLAAGHEVHGVARHPGSGTGVTWHQADLLQPGEGARIVGAVQPDQVLHLAWEATPDGYLTSPDNLRWVAASIELLAAAHDAGCRRSVVVGTCLEYDPPADGPCEEGSTPLAPTSPYAAAKAGLHLALRPWAAEVGHALAWARVFHLYGPGEHPDRLVPTIVRALLDGRPAELTAGTQARDFLHVDDVAQALVAVLGSDVDAPMNIGSGRAVLVREVAEGLGAELGRPDLLRFGARPSGADVPVLVAGVERLRSEVGWVPSRSLEAGLTEAVEWWRARP